MKTKGVTVKRLFLISAAMILLSVAAQAHLCNDVFVQAKDNLVVKVDVRDGQLRISDTGTFRVYLLNTMDRDIEKIVLEIQSNEFSAEVSAGGDWRGHPKLRTTNRGGKKEYFEVKLTRKRGTAKGKYKIGLFLHGGNKRKVFKTVDINDAACLVDVPKKPSSLKVDGKVKSSEWRKGLVCTSFYEYKKAGGGGRRRRAYMENFPAAQQTRFRFYHDDTNLYCTIDYQKKSGDGKEDIAKIYVAKDPDSTPQTITVNLQKKEAKSSVNSEGIEIKVDSKGTKVELKLPFKSLGIDFDEEKKDEEDKDKKKKEEKPKVFCVNLTREYNGVTTYWRGNSSSVDNPVVYANFVMAKK
jgi:hypothetical protein